jgi:hypothetical protein
MSRKRRDEEEMFDEDSDLSLESQSHLDRLMSLLEDSEIEYVVKKAANGKSIILDNEVVFRFNHDNELTAVDK